MDVKSYVAKELQDLGRGLERYLDGLAEEEVHWVPQSGAASITDHLFHAARFEDEFVQRRILGRPELWAAPDSAWPSSADSEFRHVLGYYKAVRSATAACIEGLNPVDLERPAAIPQGEVRVADVLSIVCCHFAQHLGAITYLRRLQRGPAGVDHD